MKTKYGTTEVQVYYNKFTNVIHVLDMDKGKTVTNAIEDLLKPIHADLRLPGDPRSYTWYLYGTDGYVSEYKANGPMFKYVETGDPLIHVPYVEFITARELKARL